MCTLLGLANTLRHLDDFRRTDCGNFRHPLSSIVASVFCAIMAGCYGARAISDFIEDNFSALHHYFGFPNGVPSHDTITRVIANVDAQILAELFRAWCGIDKLEPKFLQTDGKTVCGSKQNGEKAVHILTVYAGDFGASLVEEQVYEKQNEISAFERVLISDKINFAGKVVTGDAMFCQKAFCTSIVNSGGDWIFVLKKNHPNLFASVEEYFNKMEVSETKEIIISGHGRKGTKTIRFTRDIDWILEEYAFTGLSCMAEITTRVTEKGVTRTSTQYLIGSVKTLEELFISRSKHWSIESMHWVLDMAFEEDRSRNRTKNAPLALNVMRKIALYFFSLAKKMKMFKDHGIRRLMGRCKSRFSLLKTILSLA